MGFLRFLGSVYQFFWELRHWRFQVCAWTGAICLVVVACLIPSGFWQKPALVATFLVFLVLGLYWDRKTRW